VLRPVRHPLAVVVFLHSGGWVAGSLGDTETVARKLAERSGCVLVVPEYRLAPENPFPAAIDDAVEALKWADANRYRLVGDHAPEVCVAGEGAGGNLAAAAALRAAADGTPGIGLQILISPILDCGQQGATADLASTEPGLLSQPLLDLCIAEYLPEPDDRQLAEASPARAAALDGLPPTVILATEDELPAGATDDFARLLRAAGVHVQVQRYRGLTHGAFSVLRVPIGEKPFQGFVRAARAYAARPDHPFPRTADQDTLV
jgi:acetyl esterase